MNKRGEKTFPTTKGDAFECMSPTRPNWRASHFRGSVNRSGLCSPLASLYNTTLDWEGDTLTCPAFSVTRGVAIVVSTQGGKVSAHKEKIRKQSTPVM